MNIKKKKNLNFLVFFSPKYIESYLFNLSNILFAKNNFTLIAPCSTHLPLHLCVMMRSGGPNGSWKMEVLAD